MNTRGHVVFRIKVSVLAFFGVVTSFWRKFGSKGVFVPSMTDDYTPERAAQVSNDVCAVRERCVAPISDFRIVHEIPR